MGNAKVHDLKVRPLQSVDLCFAVDGVLGEHSARIEWEGSMLGLSVTPFNFDGFNANLGELGQPLGRLKFDSKGIHDDGNVQASLLFALRAESVKALLDKAIAARENSYLTKYANKDPIINEMRVYYNPINPNSKTKRINALQATSQYQHDALSAAYTKDGRTDVVKVTTNEITGTMNSTGGTNSTNSGTAKSASNSTGSQTSKNTSETTGAISLSSKTDASGTVTTNGSAQNLQTSEGKAEMSSTGNTTLVQSTKNTDYAYRHPSFENEAQFQRAQISLMDEYVSHFVFTLSLANLERIFDNELRAMDLDIRRLQVAYLNTILMSPVSGTVTGVFKNLGDYVKAGEPVMRVENDASVLLVGTLKYRQLLSIGSNVSIKTSMFGSVGNVCISGWVVSIRGHDSDEDEWDVLVRCPNRDPSGKPIFPINYNFDFDDTDVTISP